MFAVESYQHDLVTMTVSGDQLHRLFDQQWTVEPDGSEMYRPLQVSGLRVAWDGRRRLGNRIVSLTDEAGHPIERGRQYSLTVNAYIAGGGDGCLELLAGTEQRRGPTDVDALAAYVTELEQPFTAAVQGRIHRVG
jgi:5'-nucleotidase